MGTPTTTHRTAELRSIALHELVARRMRADAAVLAAARARVDGWLSDGGPVDPRYAERWRALLARSVDEVTAALVADTEAMRDLRQCTPFAGVVPERERQRIVREVHEATVPRDAAG